MNISVKKELEYDILLRSLIGKEVEILDSINKNQVGIKGILVLESSSLLYIETVKGVVKVLKSTVILKLSHGNHHIKLDGKLLKGTLTQRIKKLR